jgi:hypothetical protein
VAAAKDSVRLSAGLVPFTDVPEHEAGRPVQGCLQRKHPGEHDRLIQAHLTWYYAESRRLLSVGTTRFRPTSNHRD